MATAKKIVPSVENPTDNTASPETSPIVSPGNPITPAKDSTPSRMPGAFSSGGTIAPAWDIVRLERTLLQICDRADSLTGSANDRNALANLLRDMATLVESAPAGLNLTHPDLPGVSVNAQRGIMLIARIGKAFATAGKTRSTLFGKAARK